jgi:hypothetical protein
MGPVDPPASRSIGLKHPERDLEANLPEMYTGQAT